MGTCPPLLGGSDPVRVFQEESLGELRSSPKREREGQGPHPGWRGQGGCGLWAGPEALAIHAMPLSTLLD